MRAELTFLAVVTVSTGSVVSTVETNATAFPSRQFVEFHIETTLSRVQVTVTGCRGKERNGIIRVDKQY